MKGCVEGSLVTLGNISAARGLEPKTAISAGQRYTSDLPGLLEQPRKSCILNNPDRCAILSIRVHISELSSPPTFLVSTTF